MNERLLQFIWQFQYFNIKELITTDGEPFSILTPGSLNRNQGPDFLEGKIRVGNTVLVGSIELHVKTSDWQQHKHGGDKNYDNVILHVVWQHDAALGKTQFPTLDLCSRVATMMLDRYEQLMNNMGFVSCEGHLPVLSSLQWTEWKDRLLIRRLERKSGEIEDVLKRTKGDWSETFWQMLARSFGAKINADSFGLMAAGLPLRIIARHRNQLNSIEAMLLGQSGLLEGDFEDAYPKMLQREYLYLSRKYGLTSLFKPPLFLRMRPPNFPTIRLAQLSKLLWQSSHLFTQIKTAESYDALSSFFDVTANDYWNQHFTLRDEAHVSTTKRLGKSMIDNLIINTVVPIVFVCGQRLDDDALKDKALRWLSEVSSEQNSIISGWKKHGVDSRNAFDSQALIELKNNFCAERRCLECAVGNRLLRG